MCNVIVQLSYVSWRTLASGHVCKWWMERLSLSTCVLTAGAPPIGRADAAAAARAARGSRIRWGLFTEAFTFFMRSLLGVIR